MMSNDKIESASPHVLPSLPYAENALLCNCQRCDFLKSKSKSHQIVAKMKKFASILLRALTKQRS